MDEAHCGLILAGVRRLFLGVGLVIMLCERLALLSCWSFAWLRGRGKKKKMTCPWTDGEICRRGKGFILPFFLAGNSNFNVSAVSSV